MFKVKKGFTAVKATVLIAVVALLIVLVGVWYVSKNKAGADTAMPSGVAYKVAQINGKVLDKKTKQGIPGVIVTGISDNPPGNTMTVPDYIGSYVLYLPASSVVSTATITATAPGYKSGSVSVKYNYKGPGNKSKFNAPIIYLEKSPIMAGSVTGRVKDQNGIGISGATIIVDSKNNCSKYNSPNRDWTDTAGQYKIVLTPGDYCIMAVKTSVPGSDDAPTIPVTIKPGESLNDINFTLNIKSIINPGQKPK